MNPQNKGVYPNWVNDKDIIHQVLNEVIKQGGRLPYSYVINSEHSPEIQARMKSLLEKMLKEKLIHISPDETDYLEIDIEGSRAMAMGYSKYQRVKKWDGFRSTLTRFSFIFFIIIALVLISGAAAFLWHLFR